MRFLMFFTIFVATYNTAQAETLPGSDQQSYSRNVKLVSDTHSCLLYTSPSPRD